MNIILVLVSLLLLIVIASTCT